MDSYSDKIHVAKRLASQRIIIPDLTPILGHWPNGRNEDYSVTKALIDTQLSGLLPNERHRKAVTAADPALLAARWWPTAAPRQYRVMTNLIIWFGLWDDHVEKLDADPFAAELFRNDTKYFIRRSLALGLEDSNNHGGHGTTNLHPLIESFGQIADAVQDAYDEDQKMRLLRQLEQYIDATQLEAQANLDDDLPTLERYWEVRALTSGMGPLLGMSEFALQVKVPTTVVDSAAYEYLWIATVIINSIVNDLISFKKELKSGSVLSSVAILFCEFGSLELAVEASVAHLRRLVAAFDEKAADLLSSLRSDMEAHESTRLMVECMQAVNTGNLEWSLQAPRYGVREYIKDDGRIDLVL